MTPAASPHPRAVAGSLEMGGTWAGALFGDEGSSAPLERAVPLLPWQGCRRAAAVRAGSAVRCCRFVAPAGTRDLHSPRLFCAFSVHSGSGWDLPPLLLAPEELGIWFCQDAQGCHCSVRSFCLSPSALQWPVCGVGASVGLDSGG